LILNQSVTDSKKAEEAVLNELRESFVCEQRNDIGYEWFQADDADNESQMIDQVSDCLKKFKKTKNADSDGDGTCFAHKDAE